MLSWTRHNTNGPRRAVRSYSTRTNIGTAVVHEQPDGQATLDVWRPDQSSIGTGTFPNVDAAKTRAETILDPRATGWDMLDDPMLDDELAKAG
jgi:hypothetical protein